jgi:hypothetical protein
MTIPVGNTPSNPSALYAGSQGGMGIPSGPGMPTGQNASGTYNPGIQRVRYNPHTPLGPFKGGLHNSSGVGEFIDDSELFRQINLEVDNDGTLVNRPEINLMSTNADATCNGWRIIGTYTPDDGRKFLVICLATGNVLLMDTSTGQANFTTVATGVTSVASIQYNNKLWVIATQSSTANGGYFDVPTSGTISWTTVSGIPRGESVAQYRERLFVAAGIGSITTTSRFYFCALADPTSWAGTDFIDVAPGNGQRLVSLMLNGNDLVLFKEHSTYRFTYTTDPRKAELTVVDSRIGAAGLYCIAMHENGTIYVVSGNRLYELFQYNYTLVSNNVDMRRVVDTTLYAKDQVAVSVFRDRVFLRYYSRLYMFDAKLKVWMEWETTRKFSRVVSITGANATSPQAFATTGTSERPNEMYFINDNRFVAATNSTINTTSTVVTTDSQRNVNSTGGTVQKPAGVQPGDWCYLFMQITWGAGDTNVVFPSTPFDTVMAKVQNGAPNGGQELYVLKRQVQQSDSSYVFTLGQTVNWHSVAVYLRNGNHKAASVHVGPVVIDNGIASTVTSVGIPTELGSFALTFAGFKKDTSIANTTVTVTNSTKLATTPPDTTSVVSMLSVIAGSAITGTDPEILTPNVTVSHTPVTNDYVFAVTVSIPPSTQPYPVGSELFYGRITTKLMDFDFPHLYKVMFWWGISVATSGKFTAMTNVFNPGKKLTWGQALSQYGSWGAARAAGVTWGNNTNLINNQGVTYGADAYYRKFVKLMKKLRFRQMSFSADFDIITNNNAADASLRFFDAIVYIKAKANVVKETN